MIDYEYADLFLKDNVDKQIIITYEDKNITNQQIYYEQFSLTESISTESELKFGGCEASMIEFRVSSTVEPLKGKWLTVIMVLDKNYQSPFVVGTYKVQSDKLTSDKKYRDITAYDAMYDIANKEVSDWFNGIIFPITLQRLRNLLFEHLGYEQQEISLPNDMAIVRAVPYYNELYAGDLLKDICEINGCFGHISRDNIFEYIFLTNDKNYAVGRNMYSRGNLQYDDYMTDNIGGVIFKQNNSDAEIVYSVESNPYTMQTRVLYFGENATTLNEIANNLYSRINAIQYVPYSINCIGNLCIECGDKIDITTSDGTISTYVLERKLTGLQNLKDSYTAEGVEAYEYTRNLSGSGTDSFKGSVSAVQRNTFDAYTFTNAIEYSIGQKDTTVIQFNISATAESEAIFFATIPIYTNYDGELVINYAIDAATIKTEEIRQYLHSGNNIVNFSNFFNLGENARLTLTINLRLEYVESVERQQNAKILSLENYVSTGTYTQSPIDTTLPTGVIKQENIKASLFAKGLSVGSEWDGTINIAEEFTAIEFNNVVNLSPMSQIVSVDINVPIAVSEIKQTMPVIKINNTFDLVSMKQEITTQQWLKRFFINTDNSDVYTYNSDYVKISGEYFKLQTDYKYYSVETNIDEGRMATLIIKTDDKQSVESVVFE